MSRAPTVALVETATQLLNVAEWARATHSVEELRVDVLLPRDRQSLRQIRHVSTLVRDSLGLDVRACPVRELHPDAIRYGLGVGRDDARAPRLIVGDPFSRFIQTVLPLVHADDLVVVDDGTATWEFRACLDAGKPLVRWRKPLSGAERRAARATRLFTPSVHRRLTVFTSLRDATPRHAARVDNSFAWARAWRRPEVVDDQVDVLGVSLVDSGVLDRRAYIDAVADLVRRHAPVRYLAHRRESDGLLAEIDTLPGVRVVRSALPAELALREGPVSRHVLTFPSTASHTLPIVLADLDVRVDVCPVRPEWFTPATTRHAREFVLQIAARVPRPDARPDAVPA